MQPEHLEHSQLEHFDCLIILPIHLFEIHKDITYDKLFIVEHPLFFTEYIYHINKLILHRASMKSYAKETKAEYIECSKYEKKVVEIFKKYKTIAIYDPINHTIYNDYLELAKKYHKEFIVLKNPNFICSMEDLLEYKDKYKKPSHKTFYIYFRKKYNILLKNTSPIGGKWSFDKENRLKFPDSYKETKITKYKSSILSEAIQYAKYIAHDAVLDYIDEVEPFYLPFTREETKKYFNNFIKNKLYNFGPYEDAARDDVVFGYHSVLSPLLNIGLICPDYIIDKVSKADCRIESKEGYIRQLFWREYCRFMYIIYRDELLGEANWKGGTGGTSGAGKTSRTGGTSKTNKAKSYFVADESLNKYWFNCSVKTGMSNIDSCLTKFKKYGYLHHIERLMHVGNFMLLNNISPDDVYAWFMMFIDAYPWVMIPNVYGMSQYVPGPFMMTRPYFSSSNYIKNMSNFKSGEIVLKIKDKKDLIVKSFDVWDALFYRFISFNKNKLLKNYATANFVKLWKKKSASEQISILYLANLYTECYL
jgi:deoxyribodipyrimidine photolyase-related protein